MSGRKFASVSLIAAIVFSGMAPVSATAHARQRATHSERILESRKAASAQIMKDRASQERARTAQLNSSQLNALEPQFNDATVVSVGPQARAFQRVRDIAMAPTG
jgi:hypothetical protein